MSQPDSTSNSLPSLPARAGSRPGENASPNGNLIVDGAHAIRPVDANGESASGGSLVLLLHSFRRRWWVAVPIGVLCGAVAAIVAWWLWTPVYVTAAHLRVFSERPIVYKGEHGTESNYEIYKKTQLVLLRNRYVINSALRDPVVANLSLITEQIDPIEWLQKQLHVAYPGDAEILEITLKGQEPESLALIVNAICSAYLEGVVNVESADRRERVRSLESLRAEAETRIRNTRKECDRLRERVGVPDLQSLDVRKKLAIENYVAVCRLHENVKFEMWSENAKLEALSDRFNAIQDEDISDSVIDDTIKTHPEYRVNSEAVDKLRVSVEGLKGVVNPSSSHRIEAEQKLKKAEQGLEDLIIKLRPIVEESLRKPLAQQLLAQINDATITVESLRRQEVRLAEEVAKFNDDAFQIGMTSVDLEMKQNDLANAERIHNELGSQLEELRVEQNSASRVVVLSPAPVPQLQDTKARLKQTAIWGAMALLAPVFGICWWDMRGKRVNSTQDVAAMARVQLLGTVPLLPSRVHGRLSSEAESDLWSRRLHESIDATREMLLSVGRLRPAKVVLVTSALGGEGKTTVATQLAMSFARTGKRAVLVDLDLRRPATHFVIGESAGPGMAELLRKEAKFSEIVQSTRQPNLFHLCAGDSDWESAQTLCSRRDVVESVIRHLREKFDVVIVDSCPVLPVVDTLVIGQYADAAVLAVMRDVSRSQQVQQAHEMLERMGINVLGAVVTSGESASYHSQYRYLATSET